MLKDQIDDGMGAAQGLENGGVGGVAACLGASGFAPAEQLGQLQLSEEDLAQLLGGGQVECVPHRFVCLLHQLNQALTQVAAHCLEHGCVQGDAPELHGHEDGGQGHLDIREQLPRGVALHVDEEAVPETEGHVGVGAGIGGGLLHRHPVHGGLVAAGADELRDRGHLHAEEVQGQVLEADGFVAQEVGSDHGVKFEGGDSDPAAAEDGHVIVGVVGRPGEVRVFQDGLEALEGGCGVQLGALRVADGDVPGDAGGGGEGRPTMRERTGSTALLSGSKGAVSVSKA